MIYISFVGGDRHDLLTICSVVCINRYWTSHSQRCERFTQHTNGLCRWCMHTALSPSSRIHVVLLSARILPLSVAWPDRVSVCVLCLRRRQQYILSDSLLLTAAAAARWQRPLFRSMLRATQLLRRSVEHHCVSMRVASNGMYVVRVAQHHASEWRYTRSHTRTQAHSTVRRRTAHSG